MNTISQLAGEEFRDLDYYPGYQVSNYGRVKSFKRKEELIMRPKPDKDGYLRIALRVSGKHKFIFVHQLVAMGFHNHVPCGLEKVVNHINQIKQCNLAYNFEITTMRGNALHSMKKPPVGAYWSKYNKAWRAKISINGKVIWLGSYKTKEEASAAYYKKLGEIQ